MIEHLVSLFCCYIFVPPVQYLLTVRSYLYSIRHRQILCSQKNILASSLIIHNLALFISLLRFSSQMKWPWIKYEAETFPFSKVTCSPSPSTSLPMALLGTYSEGGLIYIAADLFICLFGPFCKADFPQENGSERYWVTQANPPPRYQEKIRLLQRLKKALCMWITADLTHKTDFLKGLLWHPELLIAVG